MQRAASLALFAALICLAAAFPLRAEESAPTRNTPEDDSSFRVGFVDVEIVMDNSRAIRAVLDELDTQMSDKAREIDLREREFRRKRFDLDRQERVLSPSERERRREELLALEDEITSLRFSLERDFQSAERAIEPVLERVFHAVADVAERRGIDLVLRGEIVIYGSQRVDLTADVIEELDRHTDEIRARFLRPQSPVSDEPPAEEEAEEPDDDSPEATAPPVRDGIPPAPARRPFPPPEESVP